MVAEAVNFISKIFFFGFLVYENTEFVDAFFNLFSDAAEFFSEIAYFKVAFVFDEKLVADVFVFSWLIVQFFIIYVIVAYFYLFTSIKSIL
jgi:hypothetical protein